MKNDLSSETVVKVENVSKKFCKSLKNSMLYGAGDIIKSSIGMNRNSGKLRKDEFWALDGISFELKKGEALGIIGPNGSGKTTLLKLLNGIFMPDKGKIEMKGKVGALIELGAGFHQMLTGRENIYINGAILGMSKKEINEKFDSIVDFADIGDFLDAPVKHYSSGMYIRLGFAIAIHSEPDILLIDEILSVGDISFQAKCLERMKKFMEDKSILFISHNLTTVKGLCKKSILVSKGKTIDSGDSERVIDDYERRVYNQVPGVKNKENITNIDSKIIHIGEIELFDEKGVRKDTFRMGETIVAKIPYNAYKKIENPVFTVGIVRTIDGIQCCATTTAIDTIKMGNIEGEGFVEVKLELPLLIPGTYKIGASVWDAEKRTIIYTSRGIDKFYISSDLPGVDKNYGFFVPKAQWKV
ncbi:MAG: ABC transporter ATP-binding protein [bacterium]